MWSTGLAGFSSTARLRVWNESGGRWLWRKQEDILLGPERTTHIPAGVLAPGFGAGAGPEGPFSPVVVSAPGPTWPPNWSSGRVSPFCGFPWVGGLCGGGVVGVWLLFEMCIVDASIFVVKL